MIYILVLFITNGRGTGLTTTEFRNEITCKAAGEKIKNDFDESYSTVRWTCVKK